MSIGITIDPTKAELSRIAADHVAAFLAKGGKVQTITDGATAYDKTPQAFTIHPSPKVKK
jgi:hypothetical protein